MKQEMNEKGKESEDEIPLTPVQVAVRDRDRTPDSSVMAC